MPPSLDQLRAELLHQLEKALKDKKSFLHHPVKRFNDVEVVPAPGVKVLIEHLLKKHGDTNWYLQWLGTLHHHGFHTVIFDKDFVPKKEVTSQIDIVNTHQAHLDNDDGFFSGHAALTSKQWKKRTGKGTMTAEQRV